VKRTRAPRVVSLFSKLEVVAWKRASHAEKISQHALVHSKGTQASVSTLPKMRAVHPTCSATFSRTFYRSVQTFLRSRVCVLYLVYCYSVNYVLVKVSAFIFPEAHSARRRCSGKNVSRRTFDLTPLMLAFNVLLPHSVAYTYYRRTILLSVKPYSHFHTLQNGFTLFHHKFVAYHVRTIRPR